MDDVKWRCRECGASNGAYDVCRECGADIPSALPSRIVTQLRTARAVPAHVEVVCDVPDAEFEEVPRPRRRRHLAATIGSLVMAAAAVVVTSVFVFFVAIAYVAYTR